jgi:hypothetical protein
VKAMKKNETVAIPNIYDCLLSLSIFKLFSLRESQVIEVLGEDRLRDPAPTTTNKHDISQLQPHPYFSLLSSNLSHPLNSLFDFLYLPSNCINLCTASCKFEPYFTILFVELPDRRFLVLCYNRHVLTPSFGLFFRAWWRFRRGCGLSARKCGVGATLLWGS